MMRLIGLRKLGEEMKVRKMKMVPTREKHDAIRSVISKEFNWALVNGAILCVRERKRDKK